MWCSQGSILGPLIFLIFINDTTKCSNQFKYILYADDCTLSTCVPGDNVMDSAELINSELKCLDRWLKSNKISIDADKTMYMLFSYDKNLNFPDISVANNTINETSVTKFLGIHLDNNLNFVNHITEISMKIAKLIGLLYKLNRFLPEIILKTLYTSHIHPYLSYGIEAWHGTYQNNTSKIFVLQKKAIRAINNPAYNEHTNAYFKRNKILTF